MPDDWRLFIDGSTSSLKACLLHNGPEYPTVPVYHSTSDKEDYATFDQLLKFINYKKYNWKVVGDLKMLSIMLGLTLGYTSHPCFLCLWNSRDDNRHFTDHEWPLRTSWIVGQNNVKNVSLVDHDRIILPPLHIKLGLMGQFVKRLVKSHNEATKDAAEEIKKKHPGIAHLHEVFPKMTAAKIEKGVFTGPQIRKLFADPVFSNVLNEVERNAWFAFRNVAQEFLGNYKSPIYKEMVKNLLDCYEKMGCRMNVKLHFLKNHLDFFPNNLGALSEEQGERFHQELKDYESRYVGKCSIGVLADYCWGLVRDSDTKENPKRFFKSFL